VEVTLRAPIPYDDAGRPRTEASPATSSDDQTGEICIRGENVFGGYISGGAYGLPLREGWLHSGDMGRRDREGRIAFTRILKPMFTRNGFNIYPHEIERVVREMPGVRHAKVFDVSNGDDAEPDIALELSGSVTEAAVAQWCSERLSVYKRPTAIRVV
jgi:acyl-CoA synthetase (AMP-forming)/AMP-acid ligase II